MTANFQGKRVFVTGGTRGIGASIVDSFLAAGAIVHTSGRDTARIEVLKSDKHENLHYHCVDFGDDDSFSSFLEKFENLDIDILINNAGINKIDDSLTIDGEDFKKIQLINVQRPFEIAQASLKGMRSKKWGRIVNITSIFGHVTKEKRLSYSTSKFGLLGMTKTLAVDNAPFGILVNSVGPGFIDTELTRTVLSETDIEKLTSQVPMKRLGQPEEIAKVVLFLCSSENSFLTGQNIIVDGGFTCV